MSYDNETLRILEQRMCPHCFDILLDELGGTLQYFPTVESILRKKRDQQIRARFHGDNVNELAQLYDLTPRHVRRIVHSEPPAEK